MNGNANPSCGGTLDVDMREPHYGNIRGDGVQGQVENIQVGMPQEGFAYNGQVHYNLGSGNAEFQVIFSGTNGEGVLQVYGQEYVAKFDTVGMAHQFSFTYNSDA